jgi:hypothetical protein
MVFKDRQVLKELKDPKELKGLNLLLDHKVLKELRVHKEQLDL